MLGLSERVYLNEILLFMCYVIVMKYLEKDSLYLYCVCVGLDSSLFS